MCLQLSRRAGCLQSYAKEEDGGETGLPSEAPAMTAARSPALGWTMPTTIRRGPTARDDRKLLKADSCQRVFTRKKLRQKKKLNEYEMWEVTPSTTQRNTCTATTTAALEQHDEP
eukprot:Skav229258  [mRNA]  locus=scaffold2418:124301:124943:- [translate_table: standard]